MRRSSAEKILPQIEKLSQPCRLCPRRCGVRRLDGEPGACGAGRHAGLFMEYVHWAEDDAIAPAQTLYLTGCNLDCVFCQTKTERFAKPTLLTPELFQSILEKGFRAGARTVDILGGEPTVNAPALVELFARVDDFPGLVWNTNLYGEAETFALLDEVIDIYIGDIKFGNPACAARLSGVADAGDVARRRAAEIFARRPDALIPRHLVMPGHFECCTRPVLEWMARNLPGARVSLKTGYLPPADLKSVKEGRFLSAPDAHRARHLAADLGLCLTRDAIFPQAGGPGDATEFEIVLSPEGGMYFRHVTLDAVGLLRAVERSER